MISVMDMTTGLFERDDCVQELPFESVEAASRREESGSELPIYAALSEYAAPGHAFVAAMPSELATVDVDAFLARMSRVAG